jgi:hypothetical protein
MKTGKELKIDTFKNYNIVFGSVNNKHPKAVYINISAWAEPQSNEDVNYNRTIRDLHKKIKQSLYNSFISDSYSDFMKDRTIVDLDIRESGIRYGKRSFMNCEITLFLNTEIPVNSELMRPRLDEALKMVVESTLDSNKVFKFYKKKN